MNNTFAVLATMDGVPKPHSIEEVVDGNWYLFPTWNSLGSFSFKMSWRDEQPASVFLNSEDFLNRSAPQAMKVAV
jgi:hypothetical protein